MPVRKPDAGFSLDEQPAAPMPSGEVPIKRPRAKSGFYVPVNPTDGSIDMSRARPDQLEQLRTALGAKAEPAKADKPRPQINPEFIPQAYSLLEIAIQQLGKLFLKWPNALASEMYFSPEKKQALVAPTKALADKYAPLWLIENQEWGALAIAFTDAVNDMVNRGTERYLVKVMNGQAPPPPGMKINLPPKPPANTSISHDTTPPNNPPDGKPATAPESQPVNGGVVPPTTVKGFVPSIPAGML